MMRLADKWCLLSHFNLIKMFGFSISNPYTIVTEFLRWGPLDIFLRRNYNLVSTNALIDVAYSLAKVLNYLQEKNIIHGNIKCSAIQLMKVDAPDYLMIRLNYPSLNESYTNEE